MTATEQAVAEELSAYNQTLNLSDMDAVTPLYLHDWVVMPP
jgi:ketosteroid isomerase-like protein